MKTFISVFFLILAVAATAQTSTVSSPDGDIVATVQTGSELAFSLQFKGKPVIEKAAIGLDLGNGKVLGAGSKVKSSRASSYEVTTSFVVPNKEKSTTDQFNQLSIVFKEGFTLEVRVYNDGFAYRFVTALGKGTVDIYEEKLDLDFPAGSWSYFPREQSTYSHFEQSFDFKSLDAIPSGDFCAMPVRFDVPGNIGLLITEADFFDYPCLFLEKSPEHTFSSKFAPYVLKTEPMKGREDRYEIMKEVAPYIAKISGNRNLPWRVFMISDEDKDFVASNLVMQLSRPSQLQDTEWIKPGRIAWDWYNANNIYGVDFKSGINTETYKYYIDFASQYGLEYVILDEGWTKSTTEVMESNPDIDIPELVAYGKSKNVDLILWLLWHPLDKKMDEILKLYSSWGVKGIKVDFMQRPDQYMVKSYEEIAKTAAKYHLMVDFHGAFKPAGIRSAYPNVMTYEGVLGNENNKWSDHISPEHTVTLPFTRMVAGPMDFTPGAMRNANKKNYHISFDRPMALGTRAHQVAMYVVYESPLQMLCDAPSAYLKEPETTSFIAQIPSVWDETQVLEAKIADYIVIARKKDDKWYIGAMTDDTARSFELDLSFLGAGSYQMEYLKDGINADKFAEDYVIADESVSSTSKVKIQLAGGGGWTAVLTKK